MHQPFTLPVVAAASERHRSVLIDCTILNDELELLALRVALLGPHIDTFLVAEAAETFTGQPKRLWLTEHLEQFADANVLPVLVTFPDTMTDPWEREWHTRDTLQAAAQRLSPQGVAVLADVDEFPSAEQLTAARDATQVLCVPMRTLYRRLNWSFVPDTPILASKVIPLSTPTPFSRLRPQVDGLASVSGEWGAHVSYMGYDAAALAAKLSAFAHTEHNLAGYSSGAHLAVCDQLQLDHLVRRKLPGHGLLENLPHPRWSQVQHQLAERHPEWVGATTTPASRLTRAAVVVMLERDLRTGQGAVAATLAAGSRWHPRLWPGYFRALLALARLRWHEGRAR